MLLYILFVIIFFNWIGVQQHYLVNIIKIATIPCQIPEHTTAFVGFHVFPCLPQRGRVAPSERSRLPLRGLVLSTRGES